MKGYKRYKNIDLLWLKTLPEHWGTSRAKNFYEKVKRPVNDFDETVTCFRDGVVTLRKNRRTTGFTESFKEIGYQGIKKGDLVIHQMDAFAGAAGVSDSDGKGTPVYSVCIPKNHNINNYYYAHLIREMAKTGFIQSLYRGIRERSSDFRFETFAKLNLPIPPLPEQDQIVKFLDFKISKINKFIKNKKREIELLKELKQAEINRAVTKGLNPNVPTKDSGVDWLGEIPEHWDIRRLKNISYSIGDGLHGTPNYDRDGLFYFINGTNLGEDKISVTANTNTVNEEEYKKHFLKLNNNCILISLNGTIGKISFYDGEPIILSKSAGFINLHNNENKNFIAYYLKSDICKRIFIDTFKSTTINNLSLFALQNTKLTYPPITEQQSIVEFIKQKEKKINRSIVAIEKEIILIQEYKTSLISEVVTGKIDVRDIKIEDTESELLNLEDSVFEEENIEVE